MAFDNSDGCDDDERPFSRSPSSPQHPLIRPPVRDLTRRIDRTGAVAQPVDAVIPDGEILSPEEKKQRLGRRPKRNRKSAFDRDTEGRNEPVE